MMDRSKQRRLEIDFLRGSAVLLMILYHCMFDLQFFYDFENLNLKAGIWYIIGRAAAITFFVVSGISFTLSQNRSLRKTFDRFIVLGTAALVISAVSFAAAPSAPIYFGVLHFFTASTLLMPLFQRLFRLLPILALVVFSGGLWTDSIRSNDLWLLPLGVTPETLATLDYYPLLPWFGWVLLGMFIGKSLYEKQQIRLFFSNTPIFEPIFFCGRHALIIYLLHQPVLLLLLAMIFA
jgi:uncharacterized membrane protein